MNTTPLRVMTVFGTRPEAIKMAVIVRELLARPQHFTLRVCVTGQHREMLDQVTRTFDIPIHHDLDVLRPNQEPSELTVRILQTLPEVLRVDRPDLLLVQGDTTSTFAASLAAFYEKIPVAHIEAGLRTHDRYAPFPEEVNRRLTTALADLHFAPTEWAKRNLESEGIASAQIWVTGNTSIDLLLQARRAIAERPAIIPELHGIDWGRRIILVTAHRRENLGERLAGVCDTLKKLASREDVEIVYPVHLNPQVRDTVMPALAGIERIHLLEPLDYLQFVWLMSKSYLALTDSGGIQEEMPAFGKPVLVMRDVTERPEGLEAGVTQLVGTNPEVIHEAVTKLLDNADVYARFGATLNPFGDGNAAARIVDVLEKHREKKAIPCSGKAVGS